MNNTPLAGPFTDEEDKIAGNEGWCISHTTTQAGIDEWQFQRTDDNEIFLDDFAAWKFVVAKGNEKSTLHRKAIVFIERYCPDQLHQLNDVFTKKPSKHDLPKVCTRCKVAHAPKNMKLLGIMPCPNNICNWFTCKETQWTLQLQYKAPWHYLDYNNHAEQVAEIVVGEFQCPRCQEEHHKMINSMLEKI